MVHEITSKLDRIVETGEWFALPRIISLVLDDRREVAEAAARSVKLLRDLVRIQDLGTLDRIFRQLSPYGYPAYSGWHHMRPRELKPLSALANGAAVLQLAMCHPSGHVREEAIRRSAACADGSDIPILLLRANDWVKPVRERANSALRARLVPEAAPDFVTALPMLEQMRKWGRLGDPLILSEIDELLAGRAGSRELLASLSSTDRLVRRAAYRRLAKGVQTDRRAVLRAALLDRDPAIRAWAGRHLSDSQAAVFLLFAGELLSSRVGWIRAATAQRLVQLGMPIPWRDLLFDIHAGVRAVGQQAALNDDVVPDEQYRRSIASAEGKRLGAALSGLSETGGGPDVELVRAHVSNSAPGVRCSALRALAKLHADDIVDVCLAALSDASPSVTHTARDLLMDGAGGITPLSVWEAFEQSDNDWGKLDALAVLSKLDYWARLPYLVRALMVSKLVVRESASRHLARWIGRQNRVFTRPSEPVENELRVLLQASALSQSLRQTVVAILDNRARHECHRAHCSLPDVADELEKYL